MGLGGGVVPMVHPIQAPIARTAMKAMSTGIAISQNWMLLVVPKLMMGWITCSYPKRVTTYPMITNAQTMKIIHPMA